MKKYYNWKEWKWFNDFNWVILTIKFKMGNENSS